MTSDSTRSQSSNPAFSMEDFEKALGNYDYEINKGKIVRGKVFEYSSDGVYVDMGGKSPGFVPHAEIAWERLNEAQLAEVLPLGEEQEFVVLREQDANGQVLLSYRQVRIKHAWEEVGELHEAGKTVEMRVTGTNRGGVTGDVMDLRAFIPRSHLVQKEDLEALIGQLLPASFIEVNPEQNKLVLSQRNAIRASAIQQLVPGTVVPGTIVSIKPYGVFVDLGNVSGLLHIREVSSSRVSSLERLFALGQEIKVIVAEIDEFKNRISLSTKAFERYPGELLEKTEEVMAEAEERFAQKQQKAAEAEAKPAAKPSGGKAEIVAEDSESEAPPEGDAVPEAAEPSELDAD